MEQKQNKVIFISEDDEEVEFLVLEQTKLNGYTYLLVTDAEVDDEEGNAYILKDVSNENDEAAVYNVVDDDTELELISKIFEELLDDIDLERE
ncbi:MAG: hypothetical protein K0S18_1182 [Anaerocolumna sp.]|jgi:hypothetical protein|nr:hypothetical protein [Anaerocolumna sp.]